MNAFITGAAGFMGYALATRFKAEMKVLGTMRKREQAAAIDETDWSTVVHDWEHPYQPLPTLTADVFVHAAFQGPITDLLSRNELMAANAADAARKLSAKRVILLSSGSVYPEQKGAITEKTPPFSKEKADPYASSLLRIEDAFVQALPGVPVLVVRLFYPYGPTQAKDRLIPRLASLVNMGLPIPLRQNLHSGWDGPIVAPIFIEDATEAIFRLASRAPLEAGPSVANVGGSEPVTIRELGGMIARELGKECLYSEDHETPPAGNLYSSSDLVAKMTGFRTRTALAAGLHSTLSRIVL